MKPAVAQKYKITGDKRFGGLRPDPPHIDPTHPL